MNERFLMSHITLTNPNKQIQFMNKQRPWVPEDQHQASTEQMSLKGAMRS